MSAAFLAAVRNVANAKQSTGPVTADGKARSAQNATKHGLTSRTVVLPHENKEEYEALKKEFVRKYRPAGILEQQMVTRMLDCWWLLNRALRVEAEFCEQRSNAMAAANPDMAGDAALVNLIADPEESKRFRLLMRYVSAARNAWRQAQSDYAKMRKARSEDATASTWIALTEKANQPEPRAKQASAASAESGFVSHSAESPNTDPVPAAA